MNKEEKIIIIKNAIKSYPDFPKPGILFRDIFGIFQNITALRTLKDLMVEYVSTLEIDLIVGLDSRGFLLGPLISLELDKPFLPIRKKGKLPGNVLQESYSLEYGEATFEIQTDNIKKGTRILIVDDLLATGGSMAAAVNLLRSCQAEVVKCFVVMELLALKGKDKVDASVESLIQYS